MPCSPRYQMGRVIQRVAWDEDTIRGFARLPPMFQSLRPVPGEDGLSGRVTTRRRKAKAQRMLETSAATRPQAKPAQNEAGCSARETAWRGCMGTPGRRRRFQLAPVVPIARAYIEPSLNARQHTRRHRRPPHRIYRNRDLPSVRTSFQLLSNIGPMMAGSYTNAVELQKLKHSWNSRRSAMVTSQGSFLASVPIHAVMRS